MLNFGVACEKESLQHILLRFRFLPCLVLCMREVDEGIRRLIAQPLQLDNKINPISKFCQQKVGLTAGI